MEKDTQKHKPGGREPRQLRPRRVFSEDFKRQKVKEVEQNLLTVSELARLHGVTTGTVYNWVYKYSASLKKGEAQVVQLESEALKTKALLQRVAELERVVGQKQLVIDVQEKIIELGSAESGVDWKKNFEARQSNGSGRKGGI